MSKIIEHENQSFMFNGQYTEPIKQEIVISDLKVKDIDFDNSHLVAEHLAYRDNKVAKALFEELKQYI